MNQKSIIYLAKNVVLVPGACLGAIYNFNNGKVFSISKESVALLKGLHNSDLVLNEEQKQYIELLKNNQLFDEKYYGKKYRPREPRFDGFKTVWLELTMGCNCRCIHCYEGEDHFVSADKMDLKQWFDVIDQIHALGTQRIILIGGEPCLYKDIVAIIERIAKYNIEITLFTNATLINDELLEKIVKYHIKVKVSIYGHNKETHESVTQLPNSFDKMKTNIQKMKAKNVEVVPSIIILKNNEDFIEELKKFVTGLGIPWTGYDVIRCVGCGKNPRYMPKKEISDKRKRLKPSFYAEEDFFVETMFRNNCWNGKIVISENGDVLPCVFARNEICGNVKEKKIAEIINEKLLDYWNYDFSNVDYCKDCEYRYACKDCRPVAMAQSGMINSHTPSCNYNPYSGKWDD